MALIVLIAFLGLAFVQAADPPPPSLQILRPNSSDRLHPGSSFRIQWRAQGLSSGTDWNFILSTNNVRVGLLFAPAVDDGGGNWHADLTLPSEVHPISLFDNTFVQLPSACDYTLRLTEDVTDAEAISDVFCLGVPTVSVRVSQVELCWTTRSNRVYQVQYRSPLTTNVWTNLGASVQGNGSTNCITDAVVLGQAQRYYRVEELP